MITEDYVSFETAKLLKEKGFDVDCYCFYTDGELVRAQGHACNWNNGETLFADYKNECSAPTLQMAMKWLREAHKIVIMIQPLSFNGAKDCLCDNWTYSVWVDYNLKIGESLRNQNGYYSTYEEACESAIKFGMFFVDNKNRI